MYIEGLADLLRAFGVGWRQLSRRNGRVTAAGGNGELRHVAPKRADGHSSKWDEAERFFRERQWHRRISLNSLHWSFDGPFRVEAALGTISTT